MSKWTTEGCTGSIYTDKASGRHYSRMVDGRGEVFQQGERYFGEVMGRTVCDRYGRVRWFDWSFDAQYAVEDELCKRDRDG